MAFRKVFSAFLAIVIALGITGCGNQITQENLTNLIHGKDPVQEELLTYVNKELPKVDKMETAVLTQYANITGENYENDEVFYTTLDGVIIPDYRAYTEKVEEIEPETPEVRAIHELLIDSVNNRYNAFVLIKAALENGDSTQIVASNEKLDKARKARRDFMFQLKDLAKKHNVELKLEEVNYDVPSPETSYTSTGKQTVETQDYSTDQTEEYQEPNTVDYSDSDWDEGEETGGGYSDLNNDGIDDNTQDN